MKSLVLLILLSIMSTSAYAGFPVKYPKKTLNMSKIEFFIWAVDRNKRAQDAWTKEFDADDLYTYGSKQVETSETTGYNSGSSTVTPLSISQSPGVSLSTTKKTKRFIPYRYKNPDFRHPGPLTIINPYVQPKKQWTR